MMRNFNSDEVHSIQSLANTHNFEIFCKYLDEHLSIAKESLIDCNDDKLRGYAACLRDLIWKIEEARNFKPTEFAEPVNNSNRVPGTNDFIFP